MNLLTILSVIENIHILNVFDLVTLNPDEGIGKYLPKRKHIHINLNHRWQRKTHNINTILCGFHQCHLPIKAIMSA